MIAVGDRFIPRTGEPDEEIEVTHGSGELYYVKRVRDGLTWNMSESTINTQWTPVVGERHVAAERCDCGHMRASHAPECGVPECGCLGWIPPSAFAQVADHAVPTPLPPAPPKLGDGLRAIADMLDERERLYGPAVSSWERIARLAGVTTEQALEVMIVMKRERALFSPENPDHVRDQIGYLAILTEVRRGR